MVTTDDLTTDAVTAALKQDWQTAIDLNQKVLHLTSTDIPALNRLGRAYLETGQAKLAKKTFNKVLDLDKHNGVAINNLAKLRLGVTSKGQFQTNFSFIEEPGRTKTVALYKLAPLQILGKLSSSQLVTFKINKRQIRVQTVKNTFVGYLPDDLAIHLIRLSKLGNKYEAAIKNVSKNKVEIFIRETKRGIKLRGLPSFSTKDTSRYYQFLPTEPIAESPLEIVDSEEEESPI